MRIHDNDDESDRLRVYKQRIRWKRTVYLFIYLFIYLVYLDDDNDITLCTLCLWIVILVI